MTLDIMKQLAAAAVERLKLGYPAASPEWSLAEKIQTYEALAAIAQDATNKRPVREAGEDLARMIEQYQKALSLRRSSAVLEGLRDSMTELSDLLADMMIPPASAVAVSDQQMADALRACTGSVQVTYNDAVSPAPVEVARLARLEPDGERAKVSPCFVCGQPIGDVAYLIDENGLFRHYHASECSNARAKNYNRVVWGSADMAEAQRRVYDAGNDLLMEGWGKLTLDNARAHLVRAIELVDAMLALEVK